MDFKVVNKKIKVSLNDVEFEVKKPSVSEMKQMEQNLKGADPVAVIDIIVDYLVNIGFTKEAVLALDSESFYDLYYFINGYKKN